MVRVDIVSIGRSDIDRLAEVDLRLAGDAAQRAHLSELLDAGLSWMATAREGPLGFAVVTRHFFGFPFVDLIFVHQDHRRAGVARALLAHCEAAHTADRIFTSTNASNAPMRALMDRMQWRPCGEIDALDPGDPELFFVKFRGGG
jgi:GNAT superfamily N-acetyltransferase